MYVCLFVSFTSTNIQAVEDICLQKQAGSLFTLLCNECSEHVAAKVKSLTTFSSSTVGSCDSNGASGSSSSSSRATQLLAATEELWSTHCTQLNTVRNIFLYLDRSFALTNQGAALAPFPPFFLQQQQQQQQQSSSGASPSSVAAASSSSTAQALLVNKVHLITDYGHLVFRAQLCAQPELLSRLIAAVLEAVECYRRGSISTMDLDALASTTQMFQTLALYGSHLEKPLLADSDRFFSMEGTKLISECAPSTFLQMTEKRLREGADMCSGLLFSSATKRPLVECIEKHLLLPHLHQLVERGLGAMLDNDDAHSRRLDLSRIYRLFERVNGLKVLNDGWTEYIKRVGARLMSERPPAVAVPAASAAAGGAGGASAAGAMSPGAKAAAAGAISTAAAAANSSHVVESVLTFYEKLESICRVCFTLGGHYNHHINSGSNNSSTSSSSGGNFSSNNANEVLFRTSMKNAFAHFFNANQNAAAELLARYVDKKMRVEKGVSESEQEAALDSVLKLFRHLQEKDVFEAFYKKHLSKRLLLGKSASYDIERSMLSKLKTECGSNFTAKLEGMFQDMELSRECSTAYVSYLASKPELCSNSSSNTEMNIEVLTSGYWPTVSGASTSSSSGDSSSSGTDDASSAIKNNVPKLLLPPELTTHMDRFNTFYTNKYQGRRLVWNHALERCVVSAYFPKGKKDLEVSLYQALVLRCFSSSLSDAEGAGSESTEKLTLAHIQAATGIETAELRRVLQSLACGVIGTRVLVKEPKGREVNDTDLFCANRDFSHKLFRIKINSIQSKETTEEVTKTHEEVFRDREYQV